MSALVLTRMLRDRARSTLWWSLAVALLVVAFASAYPSVEESAGALEAYMESLPEGLADVLGAGAGIASASGYLNSQWYANLFPILLVVLGVGIGAWAVAGSEGDGTLEMLLANPVRRGRVAAERFAGLLVVTLAVVLVGTAVLAAVAPAFGLADGLAAGGLWAAGLGVWLLALVPSAVTFAVGMATGSRGGAIAAGAGLAAGTFVVYALSGFVAALEPLRWASPWWWFLDADPLAAGWTATFWLQAVLLPLAVVVAAYAAALPRYLSRDLG